MAAPASPVSPLLRACGTNSPPSRLPVTTGGEPRPASGPREPPGIPPPGRLTRPLAGLHLSFPGGLLLGTLFSAPHLVTFPLGRPGGHYLREVLEAAQPGYPKVPPPNPSGVLHFRLRAPRSDPGAHPPSARTSSLTGRTWGRTGTCTRPHSRISGDHDRDATAGSS